MEFINAVHNICRMTPNNILTRKGHKRARRRLLREKHPTVVTSDNLQSGVSEIQAAQQIYDPLHPDW